MTTESGKRTFFYNPVFFNSLTYISLNANSSVIRQMGESQNVCYKKSKQAKFSEKRLFLTP